MTIRPMIRTLLGLAAFAALAAAAPAAAQATFQVTATVARNCTIAATNVNVGAYDPVVANDTAAADQTGTVTVRCTRGTPYQVALDNGSHYSTGRRMQHATATEFLSYELYSDAGRTVVWNAAAPQGGTAASRAAIALTVYARVPGGQDVPEGAYTDTVTATVNF